MWQGRVTGIFIAPAEGEPVAPVTEVRAVAGHGLEGDRYYKIAIDEGAIEPKREVTLIETEAIEAAARDNGVRLEPGQSRRNIETSGVPLNHLIGRDFMVGDALLRGIKLCEPCSTLAKQTEKGVIKALIHRGGLNAQILKSGTIAIGSGVHPADP